MKKTILLLSLVLLSNNFVFASIDTTLKLGQKGSQVTELQNTLISQGFLTGTATGYFGKSTQKALKSYQKSKKLSPTGIVDSMTKEPLNKDVRNNVKVNFVSDVAPTTTLIQIDVCKNIEGLQTVIPTGMLSTPNGECITDNRNTPVEVTVKRDTTNDALIQKLNAITAKYNDDYYPLQVKISDLSKQKEDEIRTFKEAVEKMGGLTEYGYQIKLMDIDKKYNDLKRPIMQQQADMYEKYLYEFNKAKTN